MNPDLSQTASSLGPPANDPNPAPPEKGALLTPEILFLNQGSTYRLAAAFAGTQDPTVVWQKMISDFPDATLYYRELEEKDEDVGDAIAEMKLSVMKRRLDVVPADDSAQAIAAADFVRSQIDGLASWRNAMDSILDAPFYGYSVGEMIFDVSAGQVSLLDIRDCPQELFCFAPIGFPQIGALRMRTFQGGEGKLVPEQKFITFSSRMRSGNRMGRPLLRTVYWPSWFKRNVQRFWMRLAERGPGTAVVKYAQGADDAEKRQALASAEAILNSVAFAIPENFEVVEELLKSARSADPNTYDKLYDKMEEKIYRRIVGSTLTSHGNSGGKGTQALGQVHADTKEERSVELTLQIDDVLNRQMVRPLVLWNFGPDCPMPKLVHDVSDEEDLGERITVDDTAAGMGLPISKKYMYARYGIEEPAATDELLERPAAPPPPIATPAGPPDKPQFTAEREAQVKEEIEAFDTLFAQLKDETLESYHTRIDQIAKAAEHAHVRPGHA